MLKTWLSIKSIATEMESHAVKEHMHIALTGGQLYKTGTRKDVDFIVYHERQFMEDMRTSKDNFINHLHTAGFSNIVDHGFVTKCTYEGTSIDIMYPEYQGDMDDYPVPEPTPEPVVSKVFDWLK